MKTEKKITTLNEIIENRVGKPGTPSRDKWEEGFELFKIGVQIEEARRKMGLTQQELADKCGTNKSYISRVENDATDIRLSTLLKIIQQGLGGQLKISLPV